MQAICVSNQNLGFFTLNLQIVSDLHLEFGVLQLSASNTDVLIAAGDIDVGEAGLKWLQRFRCPVVYVAGNHEYWGEDLNGFSRHLAQCSQRGNVHFLENNKVVIEGIRFLGCTLWTDYNNADPRVMKEMSLLMNDFRYISNGVRALQPHDLKQVNAKSRAWLEQELRLPFAGKTVVVTHHAPLMRSWYHGKNGMIKYAYCNDLSALMDRHQHEIDLWVHGHVHEAFDYVDQGVRVVCNPRGYFQYKEVDSFDPEKCISL